MKEDYADSKRLGSQPHNYARLWLGAFYDVASSVVRDNIAEGQEPPAAIKNASTEGIQMLGRLMQEAPQGEFTYQDMASAFVRSDMDLNGGKHAKMLTRVFTDRRILPEQHGLLGGAGFLEKGHGADRMRTVTTQLGSEFGKDFQGARIQTKVSGPTGPGLVADVKTTANLQKQVGKAIQDGDILVLPGGQKPTRAQLHKPDGGVYKGYLTTVDGQKTILRAAIAD